MEKSFRRSFSAVSCAFAASASACICSFLYLGIRLVGSRLHSPLQSTLA
ncbi:hypothetical protein [Sinorhizobium meliloti]|nr:hypothetical protein [Sinorhizobium meliloti]UFX10030.1 hypothetical protein SmelRRI128_08955 [Sinorhizobium meliloti]